AAPQPRRSRSRSHPVRVMGVRLWRRLRLPHPMGAYSVLRDTPRRRDTMPAADGFTKLKGQIEEAERTIRAAASEGEADVKAKLEEARENADERAAKLRTRSQDGGSQAADHWQEVRSDWERHLARMRERIDSQKTALDTAVAASDVESATADAMD